MWLKVSTKLSQSEIYALSHCPIRKKSRRRKMRQASYSRSSDGQKDGYACANPVKEAETLERRRMSVRRSRIRRITGRRMARRHKSAKVEGRLSCTVRKMVMRTVADTRRAFLRLCCDEPRAVRHTKCGQFLEAFAERAPRVVEGECTVTSELASAASSRAAICQSCVPSRRCDRRPRPGLSAGCIRAAYAQGRQQDKAGGVVELLRAMRRSLHMSLTDDVSTAAQAMR